MTREPSFILASGGSAVVADGVHTAFPKVADARRHWRRTVRRSSWAPCRLTCPSPRRSSGRSRFNSSTRCRTWPLRPLPSVQIAADVAGARRTPCPASPPRWPACGIPRAGCTRWCSPVRCGWSRPVRWMRAPSWTASSPRTPRQCISRRPDSRGWWVLGDRSGRRQPGAAGGAPRRPRDLRALRRFGPAAVGLRRRRGQRRGVGLVREEPTRTPAGRRRGARGAGAAVRRAGDIAPSRS